MRPGIGPGIGWLLASVCLSSLGHLALKLAARSLRMPERLAEVLPAVLGNPWLPVGVTLHVLALGLWLIGLRQVALSIAYPFIALGLVLVSLLSWSVLGEQLRAAQWLGIVLIVTGVLVVAAR